jgi:hypothetical protein
MAVIKPHFTLHVNMTKIKPSSFKNCFNLKIYNNNELISKILSNWGRDCGRSMSEETLKKCDIF